MAKVHDENTQQWTPTNTRSPTSSKSTIRVFHLRQIVRDRGQRHAWLRPRFSHARRPCEESVALRTAFRSLKSHHPATNFTFSDVTIKCSNSMSSDTE
ncbi:unnamed protein product [Somion occarium]|uniref:Uncharacterized protein n=1 Tax=Somion occarium TaxID=3059160 RepID=A0ABP1D012_9APHY